METSIQSLKTLPAEQWHLAGGKAATLARLAQAGYPVPDGFVILPAAFAGEELLPEAWKQVQAYVENMRTGNPAITFAVRSSALHEDSAQASFAGAFETVLDVRTDQAIREAIHTVRSSQRNARVQVYSQAHGITTANDIAVLVQLMVRSEISGVLFTADPITGSYTNMIGNFVYGLGEKLVSGESNAHFFKFMRPKGKYDGPNEFKKYVSQLYRFALKLETQFDIPQDIEWAVAKGKLYILQARPITTLQPGNPDTYELNDSLTGDYLWVNTNVGEAIPDAIAPLSWSVVRDLDNEMNIIPGYYLWSGNICGRIYSNVSRRISVLPVFGVNIKRGFKLLSVAFGQMPEEMNIPVYPFSRLGLLKVMIPKVTHYLRHLLKANKSMQQFLIDTPDWCRKMTVRISTAKTKQELLALWKEELQPNTSRAWWTLLAAGSKFAIAILLNNKLTKLVGTEDANTLLSNLRGSSELASLGPVIGISKVVKGEMSREEYLMQYGHRGPHEFELSIPHPGEDAGWLEKQIEEFKMSDVDVQGLLKKQYAQNKDALKRFERRFPHKIKWLEKQIAKASEAAHLREAARSEFVRVFRVIRAFAFKAGELTGIGDGVFFLYIDEVLNLLSGDDSAVNHIPARKETYNKYKSLPPFPSIIRGRFDPLAWEKAPNRRVDYYDPTMLVTAQNLKTLKGFAGASGRIEGVVRVLRNPEEGKKLKPGEILVASTTNVGWTPLFPKAAAIITDIGAPLSHAAIVARELGIPAVVGCGNATSRLQTGDRVLVDGGQGIVKILEQVDQCG